ncbi:MAG: SMC-Scp complex subunit ScpB [Candidatus Aminicenantes bacterium]|nr:SMC-Scp complex subunit ScpB [Candidatus Aminicenantes bacterium]
MSKDIRSIIEALIFVSSEPLSSAKIKEVLTDVSPEEVDQALKELQEIYENNNRGLCLLQSAGGYLLATRPEFDPWIRRLLQIERKSRLSQAALETLAIIAYHQPITSSEIAAIRGVDSTGTIKTLLEKKLIKIVGRRASPGRPLVYRTTEKFLLYFGLNSLEDLPSEEEIARLLEEKDIDQN